MLFLKFFRGLKLIFLNSIYFKLKFFGIKLMLILIIHSLLKFFYLKFIHKKIILEFNKKIKKLSFTQNYFKHNPPIWFEIFKKNKLLKKKIDILEIGSFEGMSLVYFKETLNINKFYAVDIQKNKLFLRNTKSYRNIKYLNTSSDLFFKKNYNKKFDIIYVDGSHYYNDVYKDLVNSDKTLKDKGILIIDDLLLDVSYRRGSKFYEEVMGGVFKFMKIHRHKYLILYVGHQLILKKRDRNYN